MKDVRNLVGVMSLLGAMIFGVTDASAQVIGTFRWRYEPFCNVVTLTIIQQGPTFMGLGTDDNCGLSTPSPANATLFVTGGTVAGNITTVEFDGTATNSRIQLSLPSAAGTWRDNFSNQGSFVFNPTTAPGSRRPAGPQVKAAWAFVTSGGGVLASSGNLAAVHPATGTYCLVVGDRSSPSHKAAQVTLADPGATNIVSVGTGNPSVCDSLGAAVISVYVRTPAGAPVNGNFTIMIPAP